MSTHNFRALCAELLAIFGPKLAAINSLSAESSIVRAASMAAWVSRSVMSASGMPRLRRSKVLRPDQSCGGVSL